jgi:phage FluMu protein Com
MKEYRCEKCKRLLFKYLEGDGAVVAIEVKCTRTGCGAINTFLICRVPRDMRSPVEITA